MNPSAALRHAALWLATSAALLPLAACQPAQGGSTVAAPLQPAVGPDVIAAVPLGDVAGAAPNTLASAIANPYAKDPEAVQQGEQLFVKMNCAGCHGYGAKGGMGPNLTDTYWRYGGVPVAIYKSIHDGRPQGMPAWNPALPPQEIWKLVAYIGSLGGAFAPEQYQASMQGDYIGENVAAEVAPTLRGAGASASAPAKGDTKAPPSAEWRPDAGGTPPGSKP
jgi:cytochrome c oxidase cbb3-type subunit 3